MPHNHLAVDPGKIRQQRTLAHELHQLTPGFARWLSAVGVIRTKVNEQAAELLAVTTALTER